jgi:hypothetical protein
MHDVLDAIGLRQHFTSLKDDPFAYGSRDNGLTVSVEQLCADFFFQLANHGTQSRLRNVARIGRPSEVSVSGNGHDVFQLLQSHINSLYNVYPKYKLTTFADDNETFLPFSFVSFKQSFVSGDHSANGYEHFSISLQIL